MRYSHCKLSTEPQKQPHNDVLHQNHQWTQQQQLLICKKIVFDLFKAQSESRTRQLIELTRSEQNTSTSCSTDLYLFLL